MQSIFKMGKGIRPKNRYAHPRFSGFMAGLDGVLVGKCIRVISPAPSKKIRRFCCVVLKDKFPTQTEFRRLLAGTSTAVPSSSFRFLEAESFCNASFAALFCFRRSACERSGSLVSGSASEASESLLLASEEVTPFFFLFDGAGERSGVEFFEDELILAMGQIRARLVTCTEFDALCSI